jgi:NADH-quinone oxidoreductase subunit C
MQPKQIFERLASLHGDAVRDFTEGGGVKDAFCKVDPARLLEVARTLAGDDELALDFLQCLTAVDWPREERIEVVYHLYSYARRHAFVIKVDLPRAQPVVASVASVWPTANWHEREEYDLLGVGFTGHPDLRRLMLPDDWVGHPLRKDWKEAPSYNGMSTSRLSPMTLLKEHDKDSPDRVEGQRPVAAGKPAAKAEDAP